MIMPDEVTDFSELNTGIFQGVILTTPFVILLDYIMRCRGAVAKGVERISTNLLVNMSGAVSNPAGSVGRDLNLQKLHY